MRWGVVVVAVAVAVGVVGCDVSRQGGETEGDRETSADREAPSRTGPTDLRVPIELRPVRLSVPSGQPPPPGSTTPAEPTEELTDDEGTTYTVAEPILTVRELDGAKVTQEQGSVKFVISLNLTKADGEVFGDWTSEHIGEQLAMVVDGEVIFAPQIANPITGGKVQIAGGDGGYGRTEAEDVLKDIIGR